MANKIWLISDTHFNHKTMVEEKWRPFKTVEEMNETIIHNWNKKISKDDIVYHLGDVCIGKSVEVEKNIIPRLNGQITFIKGNHDKTSLTPITNIIIMFKGKQYELVHNPSNATGKFKHIIHGHQHLSGENKFTKKPGFKYVNVNLEYSKFKPILINEVITKFK